MAGSRDFEVVENDSWQLDVTWKDDAGTPIDLTGYTGKLQIRAGYDAPLLVTMVASIPTPANGTLKFNDFVLLAQGTYYYDIEVKQGTTFKRTLLRGTLTVQPEVCQDAG